MDGEASFLSKLLAGVGAALTALGTWAWSHTHKRIDAKADKEAFDALRSRVEEHTISRDMFTEHTRSDDKALAAINSEVSIQREHTAKLFEKVEEAYAETQVRFSKQDKEAHDRFVTLLNAIHAIDKKT